MNKLKKIIALLLVLAVSTNVTSGQIQMLGQTGETFVVTNDGEKILGKKLKLIYEGHWIKLDKRKFLGTDITAYQSDKIFYKKVFHGGKTGMKFYTWAAQIKKGKINLYYYENVSHSRYGPTYTNPHYAYEVRDSVNSLLYFLNKEILLDFIKDNKEAMDKYNATFKANKPIEAYPEGIREMFDFINKEL